MFRDYIFEIANTSPIIVVDAEDDVDFHGVTDTTWFPGPPKDVNVTAMANLHMQLTWQPPDDSGMSAITGYLVEYYIHDRSTVG